MTGEGTLTMSATRRLTTMFCGSGRCVPVCVGGGLGVGGGV